MNLLFAALVTLWAAFLIIKRYKAQTVLFMAGFLLLAGSHLFSFGAVLPPEKSTGFWVWDLFDVLRALFSSRLASMGLNIMAVGGFARYMDTIGASRALVNLTLPALRRLHSPYLVMSLSWMLSMFLGLAISSASGLAMLLMVTLFPILVGLGISPMSAAAVIATSLCLDWSPADAMTVYAADLAGLDPVIYWHYFLVPMVLTITPILAVVQYFTQKLMDEKDGHVVKIRDREEILIHLEPGPGDLPDTKHPPLFFAILPTLPLFLILLFSPFAIDSVEMNLIIAIAISMTASMVIQWIRTRDARETASGIQDFFDGMGRQMAHVLTIVFAGEFFARGLTATGSIDTLLADARESDSGMTGLMLFLVALVAASSIIMGSGNAAFFSFAGLVPDMAAAAGIPAVSMILPMNLIVGSARALSPITGVIVVTGGMAGISPFELVRRTAIPMTISCFLIITVHLFYFG